MKHKLGEKIISLILTFNLVFSNFAPFVSLAAVRAQEVTPEPTIETSISPTDEPTPTEQISPTVEPTQDVTPTETVDVTPTVEATPVETATPVQEPTLAPEEAPSVPSPPSDSTPASSTPTPLMSVAPTSEPSPTITPLMTPDGHVETQVIESYSCRSDSLNGCLITDKADYAPTEVAIITGYGFAPNTSYTLRIYSTDEPATDNSYQITTDSNGSFTYSYQLDGTYRPNYTVELKDTAGFVVAKVTFTDSDTSFLSPTASGINHNDWSNGSNAFISDNIYTTATTERDNQSYENFNFNIPNGSTINGIEVKIEAKSSDTSGCRLEPRLWSTSANNHSNRKFQELSGLDTVYTFGGSNDLWGITWTSSDFNNTNFHLEFQFDDVSGNSCNNSTVSVDHVQAKVYYTEAAPTNTPIPTPTPGSYSGVQTVIGSCMKDLSPHLTCTANDVSIANVTNIDITDPCDYPGDTATFTATWNVQSTAAQRYNIGLWFAANGQTSALNGTCAISTLPNGPVPPWYNFDNNACGDISSSSSVNPVITMTVKCEDPDGDNLLNLPYCTSWDQNSGQCSVPADTLPGSPSKCNCQNGFEVPITVPYKAKIEVKKILSPSDDSGRFNLNVDGSEKASCVGNNGTTGQINVSAGTSANPGAVHTVGETACTNPDTNLNDYTSSISCVDRGLATFNGGAPITQNGVGSLELNVDPNDDIVCTITNTKKGKIIIEKQTNPDGATGSFMFTGTASDTISDNGQITVNNLVPGQYTSTESDPTPGFDLTSITCDDTNSTGDTSTRTATFNIEPGETVKCTFTNTKLGSITLGKDTNPEQSSNLKFNYSGTLGSSNFYDDDTDTYNNLLPGTYVITEAEKPGWYLNSISCSGGSSIVKDIPNRTLTIDLQPGENVNCTFNNYKKGKIYGEKFNDKDGDNYDDGSSEPELSGWTIYLDLNENDQLDNDEPTDVTNSSGRYSFENLMPGTYKVCEVMKDGWYPTTGSNCKTTTIHNNGGDEDEVNFANHQSITIKAYKIVCDLESKLPNWGNGAPNIISSTAQNFVDANEGCSLVPDWSFQWGFAGTGGVTKLAGNYIGPAPTGPADNQWKNFDSSTSGSNTPAEVVINDLKGYRGIWVRENLQSNYVPFSFTSGTPPGDSYSAELYCYKDGERYDNFDQVANPLYGSSYYCVAFNALNYGYLKVEKTTDPADDKTEFEVSISGTGTVNGSTTGLISDANDYTFEVTPGIYSVSETLPDDWRLISNNCSEIVVSAGETSTCEIVNEKFGKVKVTKYHDINQDGQKQENEPVLSDWNIQLSEDEKNTDENGQVLYENLIKGEYELSETIKDGWNQTNISCEGDEEKDSDNSHIVIVKAGETTNCQIGNYQQPVLQIFKTNDGSTKSPGGSVIYTLKLKVLYNKILGVKIKDLLPKGFVFDHIVSSTLNGSDIVLANPVYSSPGTYDLGDLNIDDEVIIKYQANINSSQEFGLYKDISWALGKEEGTNDKILALAQPEGYVSENFVGTGVKVDGNITEGGNVNLQGEVLGASTQNILPATGGNQIWVIIASILTGAGLLLMIFGFFMNKVKKFLAIILLVIGFWLFGAGSVNAVSNNLSIRVSEPKTPTKNSDFKLVFTVLDLSDSGSPITVKCFYKKNLGDSWTQFDADKILIAGGNTDSCQVNSSIVNISGQTYYFKATATNGIDFDDSESQGLIAVGYDDRDPSVPTNYKKEKISNCQYKISFKTADDGQTSRVEVYRSENNSFNLDGSTRVGDIVIGPNTEGSFTEAVPDCNKNYYYVIRAFNSAGNSSGPIGDSGVVSSITSTTITQESGAIPVEGVTLPGGAAGGQILGEETEKGATPTAKPEVVEVKEKGVAGAVKGVADFVKNKTRLSLLIGLGVLVLGYGAYYFIKKRKTL